MNDDRVAGCARMGLRPIPGGGYAPATLKPSPEEKTQGSSSLPLVGVDVHSVGVVIVPLSYILI